MTCFEHGAVKQEKQQKQQVTEVEQQIIHRLELCKSVSARVLLVRDHFGEWLATVTTYDGSQHLAGPWNEDFSVQSMTADAERARYEADYINRMGVALLEVKAGRMIAKGFSDVSDATDLNRHIGIGPLEISERLTAISTQAAIFQTLEAESSLSS